MIGSLIGAGVKAGVGLFQWAQAKQKQADLERNRPILYKSQAETDSEKLLSQMAFATEAPGQKQFEDKLGQTYAEGIYNAQKSSISSLNATQSAIDLSNKKTQAIQDLAGMFAESKYKRMDALVAGKRYTAEQDKERFQVNDYDQWMLKYGKATGNEQNGFNAMGSAMDTGLASINDQQSTNAYLEILKRMYPSFNPQQNLLDTLTGK